jgi:indoleamine 2,3-dioxygenase
MIRLQWPVLSTSAIKDVRILQRAHAVLAALVQYYVHSMPPAEEGTPVHIPKGLAVPLVEVSHALCIAPVLTFADTVLWNFDLAPGSLLSADNMSFNTVFSGTEAEQNFYISSARAELLGAQLLPIMHSFIQLDDVVSESATLKISEGLVAMKDSIERISEAIQSVRQTVDPKVFYDEVRPWWVGSTPERPWIYDGVRNAPQDLEGPSAGQSAVMHSLDVYLNIFDHPTVNTGPSSTAKSEGFMQRMRRYMPGTQRDFLGRLSSTERSIREVARSNPALRQPYNDVVKALTRLRDLHIRIAVLYVVTQSKSGAACPFMKHLTQTPSRSTAKGTGGNEVSALLKAGRDATKRAVLED